MKKLVRYLGIAVTLTAVLVVSLASVAFAANSTPMGPAPNSGDCVPDGSGFDGPNGPVGDVGSGSGPVGPAPNSGDGIPDGSGF